MEVIIAPDVAQASQLVVDIVTRLLIRQPGANLGLATGSTFLVAYEALIKSHVSGTVSFEDATAFLLDEYLGLEAAHPQGYEAFIRRVLIDNIDLQDDRLLAPSCGAAVDGAAVCRACSDFEAAIRAAGGIDLQLLGIGADGHIGFNEPGSSLSSRTRLKTLTEGTRADNARFFEHGLEEVPMHVLTQGIGTICDARHLVLLATGEAKASSLAAAVEGPVTAMVPASALQLHPHVTVIVDAGAARDLALADYYKHVYRNKPAWQES